MLDWNVAIGGSVDHVGAMHTTAMLHPARKNRLLAMLPRNDYEQLSAYLEPVELRRCETICAAGIRSRHLFFPTAGVVSQFYETEAGASTAVEITGNEGVSGMAPFLGRTNMPGYIKVLDAGFAYRIQASVLSDVLDQNGRLSRIFLRYTHSLLSQVIQTAVCNRHHLLEQQFCRWILSCLDRLPSNKLNLTHTVLADMLGVRRESITEAAGRLQTAGVIEYERGRITVLDRDRLEASACECYGVIRREYEELHRFVEAGFKSSSAVAD